MKISPFNPQNNYVYFSGKKEIDKAISDFSRDIVNASRSGIPNLKEINAIAVNYIPNIKVKPFKLTSKHPATCALAVADFGSKDKQFIISSAKPTMFVLPFSRRSKFSEAEYYSIIAHEMMHLLEYCDEEYSYINLYNEYLKNHLIRAFKDNEKILNGRCAHDKYIADAFEKLDIDNIACEIEDKAKTKEEAKKLLPSKKKLVDFFKKELSIDFEKLKNSKNDFDCDFVKKILSWTAQSEVDAYTKENDIYVHFADDVNISPIMFAHLNKMFIKALESVGVS